MDKSANGIVTETSEKCDEISVFDRYSGCRLCLHRCDSDILNAASLVVENAAFRQAYHCYILATLTDLCLLVHFRPRSSQPIQKELDEQEGQEENLAGIAWCALAQATERYFKQKGLACGWRDRDIAVQKLGWLDLLRPAFQPAEGTRRLNIATLSHWRSELLALHKKDEVPWPACKLCATKCLYRFDVSEIIKDPQVDSDFKMATSRKYVPVWESVAWYCKILAERLITRSNLDLSLCLAVHLLQDPSGANNVQPTLLEKVRNSLQSQIQSSDNQKLPD